MINKLNPKLNEFLIALAIVTVVLRLFFMEHWDGAAKALLAFW